ncbi:lateral signaling target protein 2 homolog [Puma concolor]|uniref:Lateral signaling target protein 2 homolog n=1 Tax=Puma concolor TaxID=9696 RepID=A0A6P6HQ35_PUMCO|nr:lateral signaling target protein 2 homolog [Puma concolor]
MDVCIPQDRAPRDFCVKFPEEIRHDSLAGQLWFGAECLAAGSIIMNRELESMAMRPLAKELTRSLEDVRGALRDQALRDLSTYTEKMREALRHFDVLFAEFELRWGLGASLQGFGEVRDRESGTPPAPTGADTLAVGEKQWDPKSTPRKGSRPGTPPGPLARPAAPTSSSPDSFHFTSTPALNGSAQATLTCVCAQQTARKVTLDTVGPHTHTGPLLETAALRKARAGLQGAAAGVVGARSLGTRHVPRPELAGPGSPERRHREEGPAEMGLLLDKGSGARCELGRAVQPMTRWVCGLVVYADGPLNLDRKAEDMSELFRPFHTLLRKIRDLLQTLTEEELHTLERNLCISQDVEFPIRADAQAPPALAPAFPSPLPAEEMLSAKAKSQEGELACSMQYDDQELEQLNRMVHRAGDEMSSLLSPPSACQSPAHRPGAEGSPRGEASPGSAGLRPRGDEEEGRVFFMDDVEGAAEAPGSPAGWAGSASAGPQERGQGRGRGQAGASRPAEAEEGDLSTNNNVQDDKLWALGPNSCSCLDSQPHLEGWEAGVDAAGTAEMIAHRTGGMKLSATVIFNPKSTPAVGVAGTAPEASGEGVSPSEPAAEGMDGGSHKLSAAATSCLLNSCVCCGGCGGGREDAAAQSLRDKCGPGSVISASYMGSAKAGAKGPAERQEEARPAPEALPTDAPCPLPPEDAPTSNKCLTHTPGPQLDAADRSPGAGAAASPKREPEAGPQEAGQPSTARLESQQGEEAEQEPQRLSGSSFSGVPGAVGGGRCRTPTRQAVKQMIRGPPGPDCLSPPPCVVVAPPGPGGELLAHLACGTSSPVWVAVLEDVFPCTCKFRGTDGAQEATAGGGEGAAGGVSSILVPVRCSQGVGSVADQLQTNYASDLRSILKTLFEVMATKPEADDKEKLKKVTQSLRSAALEDCALCQETLSSSELAAKTRDGDLEDPPEWVPDEACGFCTACKAPFTVIRRKHHCRSCGKIFCSRCSSHSAPLPRYGQVKPVRVCTHCYMFHVTPFYSDKAGI